MGSLSSRGIAVCILLLLALGGCNRDPNVAKRKYLESGDRYYAQGKYREASIMYRNAIKKDPKFGEGYAHLGDCELRRGEVRLAVAAYRRAIELLPNNDEPAGKLADIYLAAYAVQNARDKRLLDEVNELSDTLLKKNPNSFHGIRLQAFLALGQNDNKKAIELFEKADQIRPKQAELRFALAQVLNQDGQSDRAEQVARQVVADSPQYAPMYDFLVIEYIRKNQNDDAEKVLQAKVKAFPTNARYRSQLAGFYFSTNRRDQSEQAIQELISKEKEIPDARLEAGDFYSRIREYGKAQQIFEQGASSDSKRRTQYRLRIALNYVAQTKLKEALETVETALKDDPKSNDALSMRASLQLQNGDTAQTQAAVNDLQTLLSRTPDNAVVRYNLARAYHSRGELDAARVQYQEACKLRPDFVASWLGLGQVYLVKRDYGKALAAAESVLKVDASNLSAKVIKANALMNSGNLRQARTDLEANIKQQPDSPDLQFQMALVDFSEQHYPQAEAAFRKLRDRFPNDMRLVYAISEVYMMTGRKREAVDFLKAEMARHPNRNDLRLAMANVAMRTSDLDIAEREYKSLLTLDPRNIELYMRLGETLRRAGKMQESINVLRKGQQLNPNDPMANLQVALTLDAAGMRRESLPFYENIVKNQPDNAVALNNLAFMMAEDGRDLDQALTYAQRAKQQMPNSLDVSDTLGWIYIRKNLSDNAISIFKDLVAKQPKNPLYHYHLGMALYQKGDRGGAKQSLQTALSLNPDKDSLGRIKELLSKIG